MSLINHKNHASAADCRCGALVTKKHFVINNHIEYASVLVLMLALSSKKTYIIKHHDIFLIKKNQRNIEGKYRVVFPCVRADNTVKLQRHRSRGFQAMSATPGSISADYYFFVLVFLF